MHTDNWQEFKEVFQTALELPSEKRRAYLRTACAEPATRKELEALLLVYDSPAGDESPKKTKKQSVSQDPLVESFIDHYQISEKLSGAGPATRTLAIQLNDPGLKPVVLTILKTKGSNDFLRSSKRERFTLMNLRHPNIASFLDSGSTQDGSPYVVTEAVEGKLIDEYCNANRVSTHARIKLFVTVCEAVQYAHQRFMSHGDLIPSNILVTTAGDPKVVNFGISGFIRQESRAQGLSVAPESLEYTSPEQIGGAPVTTADDVYSLGVVLYQLLTGRSPYRMKEAKTGSKGTDFLPAIYEATKPSKTVEGKTRGTRGEDPSQIRKLLAGDLDSIVLKAIQKDPSKRYSNLEQFSTDIRNHFENRPVSSRKATLAYRAGKFARRHKSATIATCLGAVITITTFVLMLKGLLTH